MEHSPLCPMNLRVFMNAPSQNEDAPTYPFGDARDAARVLSRVPFADTVRWPESFRGGCSFGGAPVSRPALSRIGTKRRRLGGDSSDPCMARRTGQVNDDGHESRGKA